MLQELLKTVSSLAFEEFGVIRLVETTWPGRGCGLRFRVWPGESIAEPDPASEPRSEDWVVECSDARAARLVLEWANTLAIADQHPLLWPYREGEAQLAFHGRPRDPASVVAALWARHLALVGRWIPFGEYLNVFDPASPLFSLLDTGGGILAAGPQPLMQGYADVLRSHGLDAHLIAGQRLGLVEGEAADFAVLLFGSSYVIGAGFSGRRAEQP